jgi:hypothetical protein
MASGTRPREIELVLACSRVRLDASRAARVRALCREPLDWDAVIAEARRHAVDPLLFRHVAAIGGQEVPQHVQERLARHAETNAVRNRLMTVELGKVLAVLDAHGIAGIPYKGPVLAASAYGDVSLRRFADLDVLVRRDDVLRARGALSELGYAPRLALDPAQEQAYLRGQCEYALDRDRGRLTVEIHWDIVPPDHGYRFDLDHLWRAARPRAVAGLTVLAPCPEDELLMLAVHGGKHLWERLAWLTDVVQVGEAHPDLDWTGLIERARARGGERQLLVALCLARDLLGLELPPAAAGRVGRDAVAPALARRLADALLRGALPPERSIAAIRVHLSMRERRRDRAALLLRTAFAPTVEDWASVRLPAALLPLHYLLRPFRLAAKHGTARLRRPA